MRNPFTPNFGQVPLVLAGRDALIDEIDNGFDNAPGDPSLTSILIGARGTGKTALLTSLAVDAGRRGWIAVSVACLPGMLEDIVQRSAEAAANFIDSEGKARIKGLTVGQLLGVEWEHESPTPPNWRTRMNRILDRLGEQDIGLLVTVDEVDPSLDEMIQLAATHQLFVREERKVALIMAGLPYKVSGLTSEESVSFLRRASQYRLGSIPDHEMEEALRLTFESGGKSIESDALARAVEAAQGFPFTMQLIGYRSWQTADQEPVVTLPAVERGVSLAVADMRQRVLRATLDELSDTDVLFLEAMLPDDGTTSVSDLELRLGKSSGYVSQYRRRLLDRGLIDTPMRGKVTFALPFLREYLPEYLEGRL